MRKPRENNEDDSADGGSDSDNCLERTVSSFQTEVTGSASGVFRSSSSSASVIGKPIGAPFVTGASSNQSPQISLAEFLQNE